MQSSKAKNAGNAKDTINSDLPSFSIIIPAYNEEKFLPLCLNSIKNLDYPNDKYEVIVVDNGSTDRTAVIAQEFGARVLWDDRKNVAGLRNLGVEAANGRILAFIDADCTVSRGWLEAALKYFDGDKIAAWGSPPGIPDKATWVQKTWFLIRKKERQIQRVGWLESMNLFTRRELFEQVGGFNKSLETCEDVDFCYKIKKYGEILSDTAIKATHHGEADTIRKFIKKEIWRGQGNLKGVFSHGLNVKELPSLVAPLYFLLIIPIVLIGFFLFRGLVWRVVSSVLLILPSVAVLFKLSAKNLQIKEKLALLILLQIYFFSRTIAVFPGLGDFMRKKL